MKKRKLPKYQYILYDGRAKSGDTDDATVLECQDTKPTFTPDDYGEAIWAEVELIDANSNPPTYGNERLLYELL